MRDAKQRPCEYNGERIKYLPQDHIFIANVTGNIDKRKLAEISEELANCIRSNLVHIKIIKFLFDFRKVQWDSEETHMKAREISGKFLQEFREYDYYSAILNDHLEGQSFENESFFTQEQNAFDWLRGK
jgi:hypothetical protein